jgi:hypothetical protein
MAMVAFHRDIPVAIIANTAASADGTDASSVWSGFGFRIGPMSGPKELAGTRFI